MFVLGGIPKAVTRLAKRFSLVSRLQIKEKMYYLYRDGAGPIAKTIVSSIKISVKSFPLITKICYNAYNVIKRGKFLIEKEDSHESPGEKDGWYRPFL